MKPVRTILVPVDFSLCSAAALRQAARIAAANGASVAAMHVIDLAPFSYAPNLFGVGGMLIPFDDLIRIAKEQWARFALDCPHRGSIPFDLQFGFPRQCILDRIHRDRPDLVVIGAHSTNDKAHGIGTTATACIQRAGAPVMAVREGKDGAYGIVVVCVDFSEGARAALEEGVRVAAQDDAQLHILHVFADPWHGLEKSEEVRDTMPDFDEKFEHAVEDRLRAFCQPLAHEMKALVAGYHARLARSHGEGIINFAKQIDSDLVVLGTRGKWNIRDFFWGSTAERVVRECPCSILAIKPPGFQQTEPGQPVADTGQALPDMQRTMARTRS